ncbi:class I SAM-dependent methyltransferase [Dasania sp. GY-MA-18]|uniref:Class I SAM-dependent methyltransferase n=1 Tax=Dasania phycosphaerae TaxID=2950436 RepID=A0A9J6RHQ6_9GAMM|nr:MULTISPECIES: class I SAM-dependent methyltransferase [Dasania]MCR8921372.1 class I SAM-dependent methyltransferase [Dasania sp. GY-MA-18]MCZ0863800.1 class I SAM-dependent methyltransferase [Dasania phycosphaerae]MCZ0867528.1 class I SAM-dependent methyltransferase [Dasania phycosphaerae]
MTYTIIDGCRVCGTKDLEEILVLPDQMLTGVFPSEKNSAISSGPMTLVKCTNSACSLLQLKESYSLDEMYGDNYGYRSGLNASMVGHLKNKITTLSSLVELRDGDLVIDIGSNDGTSLGFYPSNLRRVGVDPCAEKFREYYGEGIEIVDDFFDQAVITPVVGDQKAKIITSFSMFYDLEDPVSFAATVAALIADDGIWGFEQSYMPSMLKSVSYDTICQEHLEYYGLLQIEYILQKAGLIVLDVEFNDVNGGSFSVVAGKPSNIFKVDKEKLDGYRRNETKLLGEGGGAFNKFKQEVVRSKSEVLSFVRAAMARGERIAALGASTKGNVLLQYCGLTEQEIECVGEVNEDKFGKYTPGSFIPIVSEDEALAQDYDYYLILPWHFREFFINNKKFQGRTLVFPLPSLELVKL